MLPFQSEFELATETSTMNAVVVALERGQNILVKILEELEATYNKNPSICFLDQEDRKKLVAYAKLKGQNTYDSSQITTLGNLKIGILILAPSENKGLNTKWVVTAKVMIGCIVNSEAKKQQMIGRSCRARGVCEGTLYINTGEDEASYNNRISTTDYNQNSGIYRAVDPPEGSLEEPNRTFNQQKREAEPQEATTPT